MLRLNMHQQYAQIGLNITKARLQLQTTPGKPEIQTIPAQLDIRSPRPQLHIDQSECFADKGYKSPFRLGDDLAAEAWSDYSAGIARMASEGDQLADFKNNTIANVVSSHFCQPAEFNVQCVPKQPPIINCEVYPVQFNNQAAQVNINYVPANVESNYQPGVVETYLRQKATLEISWVGNNIDSRV